MSVKGTTIKNKELVAKKEKQIAITASEMFIKQGFHKTSVREIAEAANLTIGNLYDYIRTKDDVLSLVFDEYYTYWSQALLEKSEILTISDPGEQLRAVIERMLDVGHELRDMVILAYRELKSLRRNDLKDVLIQESKLVGFLEQVIRRGIELGVFREVDAALTANTIVFLVALDPLRGWNFMKNYNREQVKEFIIDMVFRSILKKQQS